MIRRRRFSLMPMIVLAGLSLTVALPTLSTMHLYAAGSEQFVTMTVQPGDSLWAIAARHIPADGSVQDAVDRIAAANHLQNSTVVPGQQLKIPK
ncbi:MAG: LysM peptidoglycan-binding domain-containing protein [Candidatus Eremiobacteraeota bacterium]|nr:LysM peptidoglycan-binding domain-containing protein [Candidatus Eremiobacteraeota bacterium]MBV9737693.1 LysM peptidoglycan-binding domain-containing protein [Candidatus Eremiobacteraeota bacterium]